MMVHLTKAQIRQICLAQRHSLAQEFITETSKKIIHTIRDIPAYRLAQHIAWYMPIQGEVDLSSLWAMALADQKSCYFPAIRPDDTLIFLPSDAQTELLLNRYQILEPLVEIQFAKTPQELDIIFLPVVAFDEDCTRLGMGKGFYDKTLAARADTCLIGVAYEWQKQPNIPKDSWDIPVDMIITEERVYTST